MLIKDEVIVVTPQGGFCDFVTTQGAYLVLEKKMKNDGAHAMCESHPFPASGNTLQKSVWLPLRQETRGDFSSFRNSFGEKALRPCETINV